ncbi:hypothetical protein Bca52824_052281 [Brassica carinata]|uniref:Uncharacterized protein n=1 Tax=Brassica carinata TaxID=52824 RepID=A0A8X7UM67_BRACI|nr:hypothetical protein Bca52824_052281 [Brassica carinata]
MYGWSYGAKGNPEKAESETATRHHALRPVEAETRADDIISTQVSQSEDGSFAFSNTLTLEQINNLVLEAVPKKKGRYVGIGRSINDGLSSSVHSLYPVDDLMEQIKNKDEEIAFLKTDNAEIRAELQF